MKSEGLACKPIRGRAALLGLVCLAAGLIPVVSRAQAPAAPPAPATADPHRIDDTWQGTLHIPQANRDLRIVVKITRTDAGALKVVNYSIDQGGGEMIASSASFQDSVLKFEIQAIDGSYEGKMSADGKSIAGQWTQGPSPLPLLLERATPETAWTIPTPPPTLPPMAADADPSFEVATIKPSEPDKPGKAFRVQGSHFSTFNTTLTDLLTFAYGVQQKQIINAPEWMDKDKWDIEAQPDVPGAPNDRQVKSMVQKADYRALPTQVQQRFKRVAGLCSDRVQDRAKNDQKRFGRRASRPVLHQYFSGQAHCTERHDDRLHGTTAVSRVGPACSRPDIARR